MDVQELDKQIQQLLVKMDNNQKDYKLRLAEIKELEKDIKKAQNLYNQIIEEVKEVETAKQELAYIQEQAYGLSEKIERFEKDSQEVLDKVQNTTGVLSQQLQDKILTVSSWEMYQKTWEESYNELAVRLSAAEIQNSELQRKMGRTNRIIGALAGTVMALAIVIFLK